MIAGQRSWSDFENAAQRENDGKKEMTLEESWSFPRYKKEKHRYFACNICKHVWIKILFRLNVRNVNVLISIHELRPSNFYLRELLTVTIKFTRNSLQRKTTLLLGVIFFCKQIFMHKFLFSISFGFHQELAKLQ